MTKSLHCIFLAVLLTTLVACAENHPNTDTDNGSSVKGKISYHGLYTGNNRTIYVRGYTTNTNAIGVPNYTVAVSDTGTFILDLEDYTGSLYLSAFMDVDNSGSAGGPTANSSLTNGVYADPSGCYGDYSFVNGEPIEISINGNVTDIDFELFDNGVIEVRFTNTGHCTMGVIETKVMTEAFLHHRHCDVTDQSTRFLLVVPARNNWYCKVKFDEQATAQLYPNPVSVVANQITQIAF